MIDGESSHILLGLNEAYYAVLVALYKLWARRKVCESRLPCSAEAVVALPSRDYRSSIDYRRARIEPVPTFCLDHFLTGHDMVDPTSVWYSNLSIFEPTWFKAHQRSTTIGLRQLPSNPPQHNTEWPTMSPTIPLRTVWRSVDLALCRAFQIPRHCTRKLSLLRIFGHAARFD